MNQGINGLKRVRTKNNRIYFYLDGKRVSSEVASDFTRKDSAKRSARAKEAAKKLLYYKGKALKKDESFIIKQINPNLKTNKVDQFFKSRAEIDRQILKSAPKGFELSVVRERGRFKNGYEGEVERTGVQSLAELFLTSGFKDYKVILRTPDYGTVRGAKRVLNYLVNFEIDRINDIRSVDPNLGVKATFRYRVTVSFRMKQIYLDLSERDPKKSFKEEFEEGTGDAVANKYKDLEIILNTSI
jgi:hypothetical protein